MVNGLNGFGDQLETPHKYAVKQWRGWTGSGGNSEHYINYEVIKIYMAERFLIDIYFDESKMNVWKEKCAKSSDFITKKIKY